MVAVDQCVAMAVAVLAPGSRLHLLLTQEFLLPIDLRRLGLLPLLPSPPSPALLIQASLMQNSCPL